MKMFPLILIVLFCLPFVSALDGGYVGETTRIWSDVISGASYYNSANATLTLNSPNGTNIITNTNMSLFSTGVYYYDFVPNVTGNYYATVKIYNSTNDIVGLGSETIFAYENEETKQMNIALIIGYVSFIIFLGIMAFKLTELPKSSTEKKVFRYLQINDLVVMFHIIVAWFVVGLAAILSMMTTSTVYESLMTTIFTISVYLVGFLSILYLTLYILHRITDALRRAV